MIGPYDTPHAFRTALEARLRNIAQSRGTDLQRLRRLNLSQPWHRSLNSQSQFCTTPTRTW